MDIFRNRELHRRILSPLRNIKGITLISNCHISNKMIDGGRANSSIQAKVLL